MSYQSITLPWKYYLSYDPVTTKREDGLDTYEYSVEEISDPVLTVGQYFKGRIITSIQPLTSWVVFHTGKHKNTIKKYRLDEANVYEHTNWKPDLI